MRLPYQVATAALSLSMFGAALSAIHHFDQDHSPAAMGAITHQTSFRDVASVQKNPRVPAPTTVAGYRKMFAKVPVAEWGGADVSISTPLRDGRRVWLYGDTFSNNNGFMHSTALVQSGGTLHVSNGGKQVLPNDQDIKGRQVIYWVEQAKQQPSGDLLITAAPVTIVGTSMWDFQRDKTRSRQALVSIDAAGDLTFKQWVRYIPRPLLTIDGEDAHPAPDGKRGHWYYSYVVHSIRLRDGSWLMTHAQNWEDTFSPAHRNADGSMRWQDWRPIFSSSKTRDLGIKPNPSQV